MRKILEFLFSDIITIGQNESVDSVAEANCVLLGKVCGVKGKVCFCDIAAWHSLLPHTLLYNLSYFRCSSSLVWLIAKLSISVSLLGGVGEELILLFCCLGNSGCTYFPFENR